MIGTPNLIVNIGRASLMRPTRNVKGLVRGMLTQGVNMLMKNVSSTHLCLANVLSYSLLRVTPLSEDDDATTASTEAKDAKDGDKS